MKITYSALNVKNHHFKQFESSSKIDYLHLYKLILRDQEMQSVQNLFKIQQHNTHLFVEYKGDKISTKTKCSSKFYLHTVRMAILKHLVESKVKKGPKQYGSKEKRKKHGKGDQWQSPQLNSQKPFNNKRSMLATLRADQKRSKLCLIREYCTALGVSQDDILRALRQVAKIIGVSNSENDFGVNYMLSTDVQFTIQQISLKPFYFQPRIGRVSLKDFEIVRCLGIGGFSKVFLVRAHFNGNMYAMKLMVKRFITQNEKESIVQNQRQIISILDNPFLVKLHFAFETKSYVAFILDYCAGGELFFHLRKIKRMSEDEARFYFIQILCGLNYLHEQHVLYRDLKPQNLLINIDGHVKITDFGLSKPGVRKDQLAHTFCGSAQYMPPQMILNLGHTYTVDYYTLGALLYELICGLPPFYSKDSQEIKRAIVEDQLQFPESIQMSKQIKTLLKGLLAKNPKSRLGSYSGIKQILYHPWVGKIRLSDVMSKKLQPPFLPSPETFNFDQNQMGPDEKQFTTALLNQQRKNQPFRTVFRNFYYEEPKDQSYLQFHQILTELSPPQSTRINQVLNNSLSLKFNPYLQTQTNHKEASMRQSSSGSLASTRKVVSQGRPIKKSSLEKRTFRKMKITNPVRQFLQIYSKREYV